MKRRPFHLGFQVVQVNLNGLSGSGRGGQEAAAVHLNGPVKGVVDRVRIRPVTGFGSLTAA